ncbi:MAG: pilus assembly protein [Alphaproteobacteria bacterium]|nr:pilus assembly protein [Alphaproteobacteria bacterium]
MMTSRARNLSRAAGALSRPRGVIENCRGAALVEAAFVLPVFVLMIFGIIATGLLMWTQLSLNYAVAQAARCAAINNTCNTNAQIQQYALNLVSLIPNLTISNFTVVTATPSCGNGNKQVEASYNFAPMVQPLLPWLKPLVPYSSLTLQATACYKTS